MPTFAIATLGCKVNTYESQNYLEEMREAGFDEVSFKERADVYIINTCCVTNTAASKSRQRIHQARKLNPEALVAIVGCYVQSLSPKQLLALQADVVIGAQGKGELVKRIQTALSQHKKESVHLEDARGIRVFESLSIHEFSHQTRAFLKVQDGCNQFCSYCIIPFARGAERSIDPLEAVRIAKNMAFHGHEEIVLSGIHTGRYGRDHGSSLLELLKLLIKETPPNVRYRISSIEMNEIDDDFISYMKGEERIARHLHIPIQAADNTVLKNMNRPYDVEWYLSRMKKIREAMPMISISTDMIVGFPSESEEQFEAALTRVHSDLKFSFIHCFPYSKRDHTAAAVMPGQISNAVKKERVHRLSALSDQLSHEYMSHFIGRTVDVIIEQKKNGLLFGHSSEYLPVYVKKVNVSGCRRLHVRIREFFEDGLLGEEMEDAS